MKYQLRLFLSLFFFASHTATAYLKSHFEKIIFLLILTVMILFVVRPSPQKLVHFVSQEPAYVPRHSSTHQLSELLKSESLTPSEIEERIIFFTSILEKQPTHFDSLISLSFLYGAKNEVILSQEMWSRAEELDPNNAVFSN